MCEETVLGEEDYGLGRRSNYNHIFTLTLKDHKGQLTWSYEMAK